MDKARDKARRVEIKVCDAIGAIVIASQAYRKLIVSRSSIDRLPLTRSHFFVLPSALRLNHNPLILVSFDDCRP